MVLNDLYKKKRHGKTCEMAFTVLVIFGFWFLPTSVSAHKVMIFAWIDGNTIHTQSKFSGGRRAKNAQVLVYDSDDVLLLEGKTDTDGMFSFKIPKKTDLKIVLKASMGHQAVWTIPAQEITGSETQIGNTENRIPTSRKTAFGSPDIKKNDGVPESGTAVLGKKDIQKIIDTSLDKKLRPITIMLSDSMNRGPGFTEIMGGIGYILGLVGIAFYFANRKKNDR